MFQNIPPHSFIRLKGSLLCLTSAPPHFSQGEGGDLITTFLSQPNRASPTGAQRDTLLSTRAEPRGRLAGEGEARDPRGRTRPREGGGETISASLENGAWIHDSTRN